MLADTSATLSTSPGEGDAVVALVHVVASVNDLHIGDEFFDEVVAGAVDAAGGGEMEDGERKMGNGQLSSGNRKCSTLAR